MTVLTKHVAATTDIHLATFCDAKGPEVFSGIVHSNQIWTADPFDVESIHSEARAAFAGLLNRAAAPTPPPFGKTLLLLGEAGSGKTHLMRAFRTYAHSAGTGYCGYLQMTTRVDNYAQYILSNLIDALEQPYTHPNPMSGLSRLARGLVDALDIISAEEGSACATT
jgi:predicted ATPase